MIPKFFASLLVALVVLAGGMCENARADQSSFTVFVDWDVYLAAMPPAVWDAFLSPMTASVTELGNSSNKDEHSFGGFVQAGYTYSSFQLPTAIDEDDNVYVFLKNGFFWHYDPIFDQWWHIWYYFEDATVPIGNDSVTLYPKMQWQLMLW